MFTGFVNCLMLVGDEKPPRPDDEPLLMTLRSVQASPETIKVTIAPLRKCQIRRILHNIRTKEAFDMSVRTNRKLNDETFSFKQEDYVEMGGMPCDPRIVRMCAQCGREGATFRFGNKCLCAKCWFKAKHDGADRAIYTNAQGLVVCECYEPR